MPPYQKPNQKDSADRNSFANYVLKSVHLETGRPKTTASIQGVPQYAATSFSVSDILQGAFNVKDPSDTLLVINKALTQNLEGLYSIGADSTSSFSTTPKTPGAGGGGGGGVGGGDLSGSVPGVGGLVSKEWVAALPLKHPTTSALIWARQGNASQEMHLGTSGDINVDIEQHKQYAFTDPTMKHPWNMDRLNGPQGGGTKISYDVTKSATILFEDASLAGPGGAFGYLSPEDERFYISMAWPYKGTASAGFADAGKPEIAAIADTLKQSDYKGKRILVYSMVTGKGCVCTPGDWGPHPRNTLGVSLSGEKIKANIKNSYFGLSPDVHFALDTVGGTEFMLGWMPDDTPLGPYAQFAYGSGTVSVVDGITVSGPTYSGGLVNTTPASGGGGQNTIDELIFAGTKIFNHPNMWLGRHPAMKMLLTQGTFSSNRPEFVVYKDSKGRQFLMPALLNYLWYIVSGGFILDGFLGAIGYKPKAGDPTKTIMSNHSTGGAIDIGSIGKNGITYPYTNANWRPICDQLFVYLASLPANTKGEEIGCSFAADYANGFHVYKDANPTHLHIGFDTTQAGMLIPALKK